jgi:hypothetical protein
MPLFHPSSQIYTAEELDIMRQCFSRAAALLEAESCDFEEAELAAIIYKIV